ncbi:MAG: hypothetical protein K2M31_04695 [Muribaculaceae bacterium]|nr:hypothetical protein [Muribaculaceae bacterium]
MTIKNLILGLTLGGMSMGLSSCLGEPENLVSYSSTVSNYIIPNDPSKPVVVNASCTYNLRLDGVKNRITVSTSNFEPDGRNDLSFTSNEMDCLAVSAGGYVSGNFARGTAKLSNGQEITRLFGFYTSAVYNYEVPGDPFRPLLIPTMLVMSYQTPDALVKTFSMDPFFRGETTTTYTFGEADQTYKTNDAVYRIHFSSDMASADVIIYNIKFAQQMPRPLQGVVLKDLPVELGRNGYRINVENIVPEMLESGELTPYPAYTFDKFTIETSSEDMTQVACQYTVKGVFHGSFNGSSCASFKVQ